MLLRNLFRSFNSWIFFRADLRRDVKFFISFLWFVNFFFGRDMFGDILLGVVGGFGGAGWGREYVLYVLVYLLAS
jgi:hypothetical protein